MMRECQVLTIAPRSDKKTSWFEVCIAQVCNMHAHKDFGMKKSTPFEIGGKAEESQRLPSDTNLKSYWSKSTSNCAKLPPGTAGD